MKGENIYDKAYYYKTPNEPAHEIMALFVLRKLILQTRMPEPSLVAYVISTIISYAGSNVLKIHELFNT